jgi:hypothetical protein
MKLKEALELAEKNNVRLKRKGRSKWRTTSDCILKNLVVDLIADDWVLQTEEDIKKEKEENEKTSKFLEYKYSTKVKDSWRFWR